MREEYESELLPSAMAMGVSYEEFWTLNPRKMKAYERAFRIRRKHEDANMWIMGAYVTEALGVVIGNSFGKGRKLEYRKQPFSEDIVDYSNLTEEEKIEKTNQFFGVLELMKTNFENSQVFDNG